jgi:hypothetical protein
LLLHTSSKNVELGTTGGQDATFRYWAAIGIVFAVITQPA